MEAQETIGRSVADRNGWTVLRVFNEPYSGRKQGRPMIDDILAFVKKSATPVHYYIFKGIDRFTRAGVVEYERLKTRLETVGVTAVDSYGLIQPKRNTLDHLGFSYDWSVFSPSEAAEFLEAHRSKQEVRDILTRMIGAEIALVQQGYKIRPPTDGFLNRRIDLDGKKRVIEVPDPQRAPYFCEMLRLRAEGRLSDKEIVARVNAMGYTTKPHRIWDRSTGKVIGHTKPQPLSVKRLQEIILRPIYCGVRVEKWTNWQPIRTKYPGLVSIEMWNRANRSKVEIVERVDGTLLLRSGANRIPVRLRNNPAYPYKNVILCAQCRRPFLGSASRGRLGTYYPAYHCNRGHYVRIPKSYFEETVEAYLATLTIPRANMGEFKIALEDAWQRREKEIAEESERTLQTARGLKDQQENIIDALLAAKEPLVRERLEKRIAELEEQIRGCQVQSGTDVSRADFEAFSSWVSTLMEHLIPTLKEGEKIEVQRGLFELIFEQLPTIEEVANGTPILSPFFEVSRGFFPLKSASVRPLRFDWNTIAPVLTRWRALPIQF